MDIPQETVAQLSARVDTLSTVLEQINDKVSSLLALQGSTDLQGASPPFQVNPPPGVLKVSGGLDASYDHKDILNDEPHFEADQLGHAPAFSPEIQIQRLTAQLTAAYNRIAALEEQLLAHRAL
ncbi:MAG: hypothetical protein AAFZ80_04400 [Cyanobacteria bacterium P01_A01_bin.105]